MDTVAKILSLTVSNIRGIEALELNPDGKSVIVRGKNAAGKTSVLDAIRFALTGKHGGIHGDAEEGHVIVEIGDFKVTRRIGGAGAALTVRDDSTGNKTRPAEFLKALVAHGIALDPMEFARGRPQARIDAIAAAAGINLGELDKRRAEIYEARTQTWRKKEDVEGAIQEHGKIPDGPDKRVSVPTLLGELEKTDARLRLHNVHETRLSQSEERAKRAAASIQSLLNEIADLERERDDALHEHQQLSSQKTIDVEAQTELRLGIAESIKQASAVNELVSLRKTWRARLETMDAEYKAQMDEWRNLSADLGNVDAEKASAATTVKGRFPGVVIHETDLHVDGVAFPSLNTAKQIEVGMRVGISQNGLRVALIDEASALDDDTMREVFAIAEEQDVQVWLCRIDSKEAGLGFDIVEPEIAP